MRWPGTELIIDGGKLRDVHEVGLAPGTQIEVRSLFFNLPARRKFLRTEPTESAHIRHTMLLAGLARPEVGFTLTMDDQPPQRWMPGEDLRQRLVSIFGAEWMDLTVPIDARQRRAAAARLHRQAGRQPRRAHARSFSSSTSARWRIARSISACSRATTIR